MSWVHQLYKTYENNINLDQGKNIISPISHMIVNAHVEIGINQAGEFLFVNEIEKEDSRTLIPVTESSAGRASGVVAHALSDMLPYVAGDFECYCEKVSEQKKARDKFNVYKNSLFNWVQSPYSHKKAEAIYSYIQKESVIKDLMDAGIIEIKGEYFEKNKVAGQPIDKVMVRFIVVSDSIEGRTWKDESLINAYQEYYNSILDSKKDVCYVTGEKGFTASNHPKGIISSDYGAKMISSNDFQGYTFKGRFRDGEEVISIGYSSSQKIHAALNWLARTRGVYAGSQSRRCFLCWESTGKSTPNILNLFDDISSPADIDADIVYKRKLQKAFKGYIENFEDADDILIMALEAATTGRLSITYYNEINAKIFFKRVIEWGDTCRWLFLQFDEEKKPFYGIQTPSFYRIIQCAFGRERGDFIDVDDKVLKENIQRLLKSMLDKQRIPRDIVNAIVNRASTPLAYSKNNYERLLSTACAVVSKYYYDIGILKKGENNMILDYTNNDRSYLFGRLLAVYERVEKLTYERGEGRETNAIRLQSAYVNHPFQTWGILENAINPYFQKLNAGSREYYKKLIADITELFEEKDVSLLNQSLKENYLLGYYLQRNEFYKKIKNEED